MTDTPKTQDAADWSGLPRDMYVVRAWKPDGLFWCAEVAQVPHALAPEVRYVRAIPLPADAEMEERVSDAICRAAGGDPDGCEAHFHKKCEDCRMRARAALSAMRREP